MRPLVKKLSFGFIFPIILLNFQFNKFVSYGNIVLHSLYATFVSLKYEFSRGGWLL